MIKTIIVASLLILPEAILGQGTPFQNLNFEQASPVSTSGPFSPVDVTFASAFPGWTAYCGTVQQTDAIQNASTLNTASVDILGPTPPSQIALPNGAPGIIDGNYTAVIQGGVLNGGTGNIVSTSLEQTGTIPSGDNSLLFKAWDNGETGFSVSFAGKNLSLVDLGPGPNYTLYGANISAYTGATGLLAFTASAQFAPSFLELDDISFSTSSVPEPNPAIFLALGGLLFAAYRRFTKTR